MKEVRQSRHVKGAKKHRKPSKLLEAKFLPYLVLVIITIWSYLPYLQNIYLEDTARTIQDNQLYYLQYISQGRLGIAFFLDIIQKYDVRQNGLIAYFVIALLVLIALYVSHLVGKYAQVSNRWLKAASGLIFVLNPSIYAMVWYRYQAVSVLIALFLVLLASQLWVKQKHRIFNSFLSIICLSLAFLTYQTLALFALSLALFWLVFNSERWLKISLSALIAMLLAGGAYVYVNAYFQKVFSNELHGNAQVFSGNSNLSQYMKWPNLFKGGISQPFTLIMFSVFAVAAVILFIDILRRKEEKSLIFYYLLLFSVFIFPLAMGNPSVPLRTYFGTLGIVLVGIFLYAQKNQHHVLTEMLFVTLLGTLLSHFGAVGYVYLPFAMVVFVMTLSQILLVQFKFRFIYVMVLFFALLNFVSISVFNVSFTENQKHAKDVLTTVKAQGIAPADASQYRLYLSGQMPDKTSEIERFISVATTGIMSKNTFSNVNAINRQTLYGLFYGQGYNFAGIYKLSDEKIQQAGIAEQLDETGSMVDGKNVYVKLGK